MISVMEMRDLENKAEAKGISKLQLMGNAGIAVSKILEEKIHLSGKRILVACYHGNNGGDGFACAIELSNKAELEVLFVGDEERMKNEAEHYFRQVLDNDRLQFTGLEYVDFSEYDIIIDALLGTGIKGKLNTRLQSTISGINSSSAFKVSIDVPSGTDPDTGMVDDIAVKADLIICLHDIKKGLISQKDKVVIADIGLSGI